MGIFERIQDGEFEFDKGGKDVKNYKNRLRHINKLIKQYEKELTMIVEKAQSYGTVIPFEDLAQKHRLTNEQKYVLLLMFFEMAEKDRDGYSGRHLLQLLGYNTGQFIEKSRLFENLLKKKLIKVVDYDHSKMLFEADFVISSEVITQVVGKGKINLEEKVESPGWMRKFFKREEQEISPLEVREPVLSFDEIVLSADKKREIQRLLYQAKNRNSVFKSWGLEETIKYGKGITMLFYGPSGTGKTATCEAIAHYLNKKIGIANYAGILNSWVGESEKNIVMVFEQAKKEDCVLVFDEADALFGTRLYEHHSTDRMLNFMTNILMQEIEKFEGVVVLTTNREVVMDEAFARRIILKLKFDIPNADERAKIWRILISPKTPLDKDVNFERLGKCYELTGGEIKNAILNAVMDCASRNKKRLTMSALMEFAEKEMEKKNMTHKRLGFYDRLKD
jgi:ATP-dependent 26S proteasome regulatory subunit